MVDVAFLGLGSMGAPMARRVLLAGHRLTVWNRTRSRAEPFEGAGARVAATPREAAESAAFVATMLADPDAVLAAARGEAGLVAGLEPGKVWLDFSTVRPEDSRRFAALAVEKGAEFCDVPVAGSIGPARDGTLTVLAGGDPAALERARPVLDAVSKEVHHFGPVGAGSAMKLVNNLLLGVALVGLGESLRLAERLGVDFDRALAWLESSVALAPYAKTKIEFLRAGGEPPSFPVRLMEKDLRLMVEAGGRDLLVTDASRASFRNAREDGLGDADFSRVVEHLAGRPLRRSE
ncbi:MAG TPA: NAD(P)-dependent oxidoreductase [Thermoanaerobaculia bacterium]|nr:NAD(P)-dependent oxidoreductase [Thermoanaerobaculia bacterium]